MHSPGPKPGAPTGDRAAVAARTVSDKRLCQAPPNPGPEGPTGIGRAARSLPSWVGTVPASVWGACAAGTRAACRPEAAASLGRACAPASLVCLTGCPATSRSSALFVQHMSLPCPSLNTRDVPFRALLWPRSVAEVPLKARAPPWAPGAQHDLSLTCSEAPFPQRIPLPPPGPASALHPPGKPSRGRVAHREQVLCRLTPELPGQVPHRSEATRGLAQLQPHGCAASSERLQPPLRPGHGTVCGFTIRWRTRFSEGQDSEDVLTLGHLGFLAVKWG